MTFWLRIFNFSEKAILSVLIAAVRMNEFAGIPGTEEIIERYRQNQHKTALIVNCHVHTPYSFSAFDNMEELFVKARQEGVHVLGINDFNGADGYDEFLRLAKHFSIFPLFNMELIGLMEAEQKQNIRINDPNNPGRTYFCGKGLRYPFSINRKNETLLRQVREASRRQVMRMTENLQSWLHQVKAPFRLSYTEIRRTLAKDMVRERHIAKMLRIKINECIPGEADKKRFLRTIYSGRDPEANLNDPASLEEELRANLLKSGGIAFVAESPDAFLPVHEAIGIVQDAGGIPCYPVLLDDKKGSFTEFEADFQHLRRRLQELGVGMVELIPGRNDFLILKRFVKVFDEAGFVIVFGTEHNTPAMTPLTLSCRGNIALDDELQQIAVQGCCLLAAHQYLVSRGKSGLADSAVLADSRNKLEYIELGHAVIDKFINP
jgi:PHP domain